MKRESKNLILWFGLLLLASGCADEDQVGAPVPPGPEPEVSHLFRVPADHSTIQGAINAASDGDTVLVADGTYTGEFNRDLDLGGKALIVRSENGPFATVIDAGGADGDLHRAFIFQDRTERGTVIDGFTMKNGYIGEGGALWLRAADPIIRNCVFVDNLGLLSGGTIRCKSSDPFFISCTFVGSSAPVGGLLYCIAGSVPRFENCLVAFGLGGGTVGLSGSIDSATFSCSNIFGNVGGDWTEEISDQQDTDGNFSADPLFCDRATSDFRLTDLSPCAPSGNECGELVGALPVSDCVVP